MTYGTVGSIATFIAQEFNNLPDGVSGALIELVDISRQHVANYIQVSIGSNSIDEVYVPAITYFAKGEVISMLQSQIGGGNLSLGELSVDGMHSSMNADQYKQMGEFALKAIGKRVRISRVIAG